MDRTEIILAIIGGVVTLSSIALPIILPVVLNKAHKKTRIMTQEAADREHEELNGRLDALDGRLDKLCVQVSENFITTQGLHLLDIIEHRPHCWETIRQLFAAYSKAGGNGHVAKVYNQWEQVYGIYYDAGEVPPVLLKHRTENKQP